MKQKSFKTVWFHALCAISIIALCLSFFTGCYDDTFLEDYAKLEKDLSSSKSELESLQTKYDAALKENEALSNDNETAKNEIDALKAENATAKQEIDDLKAENAYQYMPWKDVLGYQSGIFTEKDTRKLFKKAYHTTNSTTPHQPLPRTSVNRKS